MITGGYSNKDGMDQVILFNWSTFEQCSMPPLPYNVSGKGLFINVTEGRLRNKGSNLHEIS